MNKVESSIYKQAPLSVKRARYFDWVNLDQIYIVVMEEWPSMRHGVVLYGYSWCQRSYVNEGGLWFASSQLIKGRGWKHEKVVDDYHVSEYIVCL